MLPDSKPYDTMCFKTALPVSSAEAFAWHERPGAFSRLLPPFEPVRLVKTHPDPNRLLLTPGSTITLAIPLDPWGVLRLPWVCEHTRYQPGELFEDIQRQGPFAFWRHTHCIKPAGILNTPDAQTPDDTCFLEDTLAYRLPLWPLSHWILNGWVNQKLTRLFAYRHRMIYEDLVRHRLATQKGVTAMKILVTGSTGLVGSALLPFLSTGGHQVYRLVRHKAQAVGQNALYWKPDAETLAQSGLDLNQLEDFDAVIHLAGENIAAGRWTAEKKQAIRQSRVNSTRLLAEAFSQLKNPPKVWVCASAIGYYGASSGNSKRHKTTLSETSLTDLTEVSEAGNDYLANVCQAWESATQPATAAGVRVALLRFGVVLSPKGGALAKMLPIFQLGAGGPLGSGKQWMSWVALDDVVGAIHHALITDTLRGPVNVVSPEPVRNAEYSRILGKILWRPAFAPAPAFMIRLMLGEMADALLLSSAKVRPVRLQETGYRFQYPKLEQALRHQLGK